MILLLNNKHIHLIRGILVCYHLIKKNINKIKVKSELEQNRKRSKQNRFQERIGQNLEEDKNIYHKFI